MEELSNTLYQNMMQTKKEDGRITFFTPTFNRNKYLPRIAEMLRNQTNQNFVWILVNDGSTDETDRTAKTLLRKVTFPMLYITKENGHKHSCFKEALNRCQTDFFLCLDDDDLYSTDAVEFLLNKWREIKAAGKQNVGAIRTLTKRADGSFVAHFKISDGDIGKEFDETTLVMKYVKKMRMENWTCYDTDKLRSIDLFPDNYWLCDKHKFFSESIWQSRFARKYMCRYVFTSLRVYNEETESILRGKKSEQRTIDAFINSHMILNEQYDYICMNKIILFRRLLSIGALRNSAHISLMEQIQHTQHLSLKCLLLLSAPFSWFLYKIQKR